jgi:ribosomal protein S18 acetylase RimI-like enzyme
MGSHLTIKIRVFQIKDKSTVVRLWRDCGLVVPANDPSKDIERKLKLGSRLFLVAVDRKKIVGTVMGGYEGHRGWVNYLAVDPTRRRSGIGRLLMSKIETRLKKLGCPKINLQVRETNAGVRAFYEKVGFTQDKVISMGKRIVED